MREPVRDKGRLEHIVEAIDRILDFMADKSFEEISKDKLEYYGIVKCIEIVACIGVEVCDVVHGGFDLSLGNTRGT